MYTLDWKQPGRRTGLTSDGYKAPSLLQTINSPNDRNTARPRTSQPSTERMVSPVKQRLSEDAIYAMPKDESDSSSDEENAHVAADIKPTHFIRRGSEEPNAKTQKLKGGSKGNNNTKKSSISAKNNATKTTRSARSSRQVPPKPSGFDLSSPLAPSSSGKRKNGETSVNLSTGMGDQFGQVRVKKSKVGKTYGSTSQKSNARHPQHKPPKGSPQVKLFKFPANLDPSSDRESDINSPQKHNFKKLDPTEFDSPEKEIAISPSGAAFRKLDTNEFDSPVRPFADSPLKSRLRKIDNSGLGSSSDESEVNPLELKKLGVHSRWPPKTSKLPEDELPSTQLPTFKKYAIEGDLADKVHSIIGPRTNISNLVPIDEDDDDIFMTQLTRCPMCRKPVDPEELKECGEMNIRQQEKFCRAHRRKDAKDDWSLKGYPEIDWDILDSRISQHYAFVKQLVDGADSHYRSILSETVKAGKDRTLLKSEANLTPGYYGTRGLCAVSENIMQEFTPLLKKRVVKDRLMAARGVTGFVQSVLVPEVAVLLIMEDMNIMTDEARSILKDSVEIGELVNEEIRDIVVRRVEDSDEEDGGESGGDYD